MITPLSTSQLCCWIDRHMKVNFKAFLFKLVIFYALFKEKVKVLPKHSRLSPTSPGPSCSKLTMSLVNVSLNFQKLSSQICQYFLLKKCEKLLHCKSFSHFFNKNFSVLDSKAIKHLRSLPLNELVKLTML